METKNAYVVFQSRKSKDIFWVHVKDKTPEEARYNRDNELVYDIVLVCDDSLKASKAVNKAMLNYYMGYNHSLEEYKAKNHS